MRGTTLVAFGVGLALAGLLDGAARPVPPPAGVVVLTRAEPASALVRLLGPVGIRLCPRQGAVPAGTYRTVPGPACELLVPVGGRVGRPGSSRL